MTNATHAIHTKISIHTTHVKILWTHATQGNILWTHGSHATHATQQTRSKSIKKQMFPLKLAKAVLHYLKSLKNNLNWYYWYQNFVSLFTKKTMNINRVKQFKKKQNILTEIKLIQTTPNVFNFEQTRIDKICY